MAVNKVSAKEAVKIIEVRWPHRMGHKGEGLGADCVYPIVTTLDVHACRMLYLSVWASHAETCYSQLFSCTASTPTALWAIWLAES